MVYLISLLEKFLILYCAPDIISQQCSDSHSACCNKNLIREEITVKELLKNFLMDKLNQIGLLVKNPFILFLRMFSS